MNRFAISILTAGAFAIFSANARAVVLDWDSVAWASGSLSNSYDVDPSKPGNDITVTISGDTAQFQNSNTTPNVLTPAITMRDQGGLTPQENALTLAVNFTSSSQSVTITIDFSALYAQGVQNVSFKIFDVDLGSGGANSGYQDQLRSITATSIDGVTLIAPTITTSANNTLSGTGLNQVVDGTVTTADTGATSGDANVTISFGTAAIKSLTFTYGDNAAAPADPGYEHISVHDIDFTPIPEINPALLSAMSCTAAAGLALHLRRRARK